MRVVVAPDSFGGTLSATDAAAAIAAGWWRTAPDDELRLLPLADGGTGFVDVLHASVGGEKHDLDVTGPLGARVRATWLRIGDTAYVEVASACGLHLVPRAERRPATALRATSRGVGELIAAALAAGVTEIVVGLGGSACTDGGAGMLAALGAPALDADGGELGDGGGALGGIDRLRGMPEFGDVRLVTAADVDNPLLGRHGAAAGFGPQKGADASTVAVLESGLERFADVLAVACGRDVRALDGAGAAGGLGAALLACGAERVSGAALVRRLTGLDAQLDEAQLVITGEGSFDWQSLRGKLVTGVAQAAAERGLPCVVLAGQVSVGRREAGAVGVEAAYGVAEHAGGVAASMADPGGTLAALAEHVAHRWSRP